MEEKVMVSDALKGMNAQLGGYGQMIPQTENKELKQTLKQMRNQAELSQEQLYQMAKEKGYYTPAQWASDEEVMNVKNLFV